MDKNMCRKEEYIQMNDGNILDYDEIYEVQAEKFAENYLEEHDPHSLHLLGDKCTCHTADTLDEYIDLLVHEFINVELRSGLEKYLMELLEDDWFHQWTFVHWAYVTRLIYKAKSDRAQKKAVELLQPLVEDKCPGALYDMGYCYIKSIGLEYSYDKAIRYWILSSQLGYIKAQKDLMMEYIYDNRYKNLPDELRLQFHHEITKLILKDNEVDEYDIPRKFDEKERAKFKKFCKETKKLEEAVQKQQRLQELGKFFWGEDENPYKTNL